MRLGLLIVFAAFLPCCRALAADLQPTGSETFKTADGWTLAADYRPPRKNHKVVVMIRSFSTPSREWNLLAERLGSVGLGILAFDLRGYGKSTQGPLGAQTYKDFTQDSWAECIKDLDAAVAFLGQKGIPERRVALAGSRVGANVAAMAAVRHPKVAWLLLVSPSEDIHGLSVGGGGTMKTLLVASQDDTESMTTCRHLVDADISRTFYWTAAGRGSALFEDKALLDKVVDWATPKSEKVSK